MGLRTIQAFTDGAEESAARGFVGGPAKVDAACLSWWHGISTTSGNFVGTKGIRGVVLSILLGSAWGLLAAAIHFLLLRRTISKRVVGRAYRSEWTVHASSVVRIVLVGGLMVGAAFVQGVRLDAAVLAYAAGHLSSLIYIGVKLSREGQVPPVREM